MFLNLLLTRYVKVYQRVVCFLTALIEIVGFAAESLANIDSQQSVLKKQVTQLTILDLPALEEQNVVEDKQLSELERRVSVCGSECAVDDTVMMTV